MLSCTMFDVGGHHHHNMVGVESSSTCFAGSSEDHGGIDSAHHPLDVTSSCFAKKPTAVVLSPADQLRTCSECVKGQKKSISWDELVNRGIARLEQQGEKPTEFKLTNRMKGILNNRMCTSQCSALIKASTKKSSIDCNMMLPILKKNQNRYHSFL